MNEVNPDKSGLVQEEILHPSATPSTALRATAYSGQASFVQNDKLPYVIVNKRVIVGIQPK
ncbi:MAG: hypothetical protein ABIL62_05845, partial [Planctomycetota bacterium]